jgi:hypothetical protein
VERGIKAARPLPGIRHQRVVADKLAVRYEVSAQIAAINEWFC